MNNMTPEQALDILADIYLSPYGPYRLGNKFKTHFEIIRNALSANGGDAVPDGFTRLAFNRANNEWLYLNHAGTWQTCPCPTLPSVAVPDGFALVPVDRDGGAKITNEMKGHHIGEYKFQQERPCPKCALHLEDHYDEVECLCGGSEEMTYQESVTVPWDVCKDIYKGMAKTAMLSAAPQPQAEDLTNETLKAVEGVLATAITNGDISAHAARAFMRALKVEPQPQGGGK